MPPKKTKKELTPEEKRESLKAQIEALKSLIEKAPADITALKGELELIKPLSLTMIPRVMEDELADAEDDLEEMKANLQYLEEELKTL